MPATVHPPPPRLRPGLWLRWSWRDLRSRWAAVTTVALIVAVGTGAYSALTASTGWRRQAADASYTALGAHDLRVRLAPGETVAAGELTAALAGLDGVAAEERLVVPVQVDASTAGSTILVPGSLTGVDLSGGGPQVDAMSVTAGRLLQPGDAGAPVAVVDHHFAEAYDLPVDTEIRLGGGHVLRTVGRILTPEFFVVTTESGAFFDQAGFAALFASRETVQAVAGAAGRVNDLVVRLAPGVDAAAVRADLAAAFNGAAVETLADDPAHRLLSEYVESRQRFFDVFAVLIAAGAIAAAFNLTNRMGEALRREIGVAMALGVPGRRIAFRFLLLGSQVGLLGAALGVGVGVGLSRYLAGVIEGFFPMPVWEPVFRPGLFARVAAIGFVLQFAATVLPVWRAVRVTPVEALRPSHLAVRLRGRRLLPRRRTPVSTFRRLPVRNLVRAPRRAVLTVTGIGGALAVLVALLGMVDTFRATIDRGEAEVTGTAPERVVAGLDRVYPSGTGPVAAVAASPLVGAVTPSLQVDASVQAGGRSLDLLLSVRPLTGPGWHPTLSAGAAGPGLLLSERAAADLGVGVGDEVVLRHPARRAGTATEEDTPLVVVGLHAHPFRFVAYVDPVQAAVLGLDGLVGQLDVLPAAGVTEDRLRRALFDVPGVVGAEAAGAFADVIRRFLDDFLGVLGVIEGLALALALLVAVNAATINADERSRETATMLAFGVGPGRVTGMNVVEGALTGMVATAVGLGLGLALLGWLVGSLVPDILPDIALTRRLSPGSVGVVAALGVVGVALAPLLVAARMRRMDIPGTLRTVD
jgi:putative ABC transport system permease protein